MYILELMTLTNPRITIAISSPEELYQIASIIDISKYTVVWRIQEYSPKDFGWSMAWDKYANKFTEEHFKLCR